MLWLTKESHPFPSLGVAFYSAMWGAKAAPRKANYPQRSIYSFLQKEGC